MVLSEMSHSGLQFLSPTKLNISDSEPPVLLIFNG